MIDDATMFNTWRHLRKKDTHWLRSSQICDDRKCAKKMLLALYIWPDWFTSHQSHYCLYYNGIPEVFEKKFDVNS